MRRATGSGSSGDLAVPAGRCRGPAIWINKFIICQASFGFVADLCFMLFNLQPSSSFPECPSCCIACGGSKSHLVTAPRLYLPLPGQGQGQGQEKGQGQDSAEFDQKLLYKNVAQRLFILLLVYFWNYVYLGYSFTVCVCVYFPVALAAISLRQQFFFYFLFVLLFK